MVAWTFVEFGDVGSTQAIAKDLAAQGAPEGTTVVAKSQSSGRGRLGRAWSSPAGGLYMSFVLRPSGITNPELITLAAAVAIVDGIKRATGLDTRIRWPNDVMVKKKKLAGVIAQAKSNEHQIVEVIVGVGVNCNAPVLDTMEVGKEATSLAEELGRRLEISELKRAILNSFSRLYEGLRVGEDLIPLWKGHVGTIGRAVLVRLKTDETAFSYRVVGIDPEGNLMVTKDGKQTIVHAEDLEWLKEQT